MAIEPEKETAEVKIAVTAGRPKVDLDNGTYPMTIVAINEAFLPNPQYGDGNVVRIDMELVDLVTPDGEPIILDTIANPKLSPKSKLGGWCKALGFDLEIGQEFELDELIGAKGLAVIENETKDGQDWPRVVNIVGAPKSSNGSVRKADGSPDFDAFWKQAKEAGYIAKDLREQFGFSDIPKKTAEELEGILAVITGADIKTAT